MTLTILPCKKVKKNDIKEKIEDQEKALKINGKI